MKTNSINSNDINKMFEIAEDSMKRSLNSVVKGPEKDLYTRYDRDVSRITVNGKETIIVW